MRGEGDRSCNECVDLLLVSSIKVSPEEEQSLRRKPSDFLIFNDEDNILRISIVRGILYNQCCEVIIQIAEIQNRPG